MPATPKCAGEGRRFICGLCGRPPEEPCPKRPSVFEPCESCKERRERLMREQLAIVGKVAE